MGKSFRGSCQISKPIEEVFDMGKTIEKEKLLFENQRSKVGSNRIKSA